MTQSTGLPTISSHTQLSMFTANGLLFGATRGATRGVMAPYVQYLEAAYRDWSKTQHYGSWKNRGKCYSWLCSLEELYSRRNPEPAVLYALERPHAGTIRRAGQPLPGPQRPGPVCAHWAVSQPTRKRHPLKSACWVQNLPP